MKRVVSFVSVLLAVCAPLLSRDAQAQPSLTSEVAPQRGRTNDLFLFTVTLTGAQNSPAPKLTDSDDFAVSFIGPRTSISIMNGTMTSRVSYVYQLTPKREGTLRTPVASLTLGGETLTAPAEEVTVAAGSDPASSGGSADIGDLVMLRQTAAPQEVWEGEQVVHTLSVYTRVDLNDLSIEEPSVEGVWQETIVENQRSRRVVDNVEYTTVEGAKALFPLRSGAITIPSRTMKAKTPKGLDRGNPLSFDPFSDGFFDQFFRRVELQPISATSNEISLRIKPLPAIPDHLKRYAPSVPIVGTTSIQVNYPLAAMNTGETKPLTIEVTSEGNLNPVKSLPLEVPARFKLYEERSEVSTERRNGKLLTRKRFRYSILALSPGLARIPGVKLTYFDPSTGAYNIAGSSDIAFPVRGADLASSQAETPAAGDQQSPETSSDTAENSSSPEAESPLAYEEASLMERFSHYVSLQMALLIIATVLGIACILGFRKKSTVAPVDPDISLATLSGITELRELESFVRRLLAARMKGVSDSSTLDELRSRATSTLTEKSLALSITSILDDLEVFSYGNTSQASPPDLEPLKARVREVVSEWEK